jgi:hypothetical protein
MKKKAKIVVDFESKTLSLLLVEFAGPSLPLGLS